MNYFVLNAFVNSIEEFLSLQLLEFIELGKFKMLFIEIFDKKNKNRNYF